MAKLAAQRYAEALFQIGQEQGCLDKLFDNANILNELFQQNKSFEKILVNPKISEKEKIDLIETIFDRKIETNLIGFFHVVFTKNREKEIDAILSAFIKKVQDLRKITVAKITSANPLSSQQLVKIVKILSENMNKEVLPKTYIDQSLIGGVSIKIDGRIIDYSIKKQLKDIRTILY